MKYFDYFSRKEKYSYNTSKKSAFAFVLQKQEKENLTFKKQKVINCYHHFKYYIHALLLTLKETVTYIVYINRYINN